MGVMSRRVLPACGRLCCCFPGLRARSRQPVKRYKKLLASIFPRHQEADPKPNDRMIGKLCDYAAKNPLRIPKITEYLEQRFYKDLRSGNFGSAKIVLCVYRKLLSSCKAQMPMFACSLLEVIQTLLEQNRQEEMQILACNALIDFINVQVEGTYMFNIEGLVPKLCQLAQEVGDNDRALRLRAAGLQALCSMVQFMGQQSHVPLEFDKIISATLDNFVDIQIEPETGSMDGEQSPGREWWIDINIRQLLDPPANASESPSYWSKVCLHNMTLLAKRATSVRRVLEPFFHNFDSEDYWSPENGRACSVLMLMQLLLEESGENSHVLLSILVKHLDHKNVVKQPLKQINIINVISRLAQNAKKHASVIAITGALSDLLKHLRKCMQYSTEPSGPAADKLNVDLQLALEKCISQLSDKVGDIGPILDMMAAVLENVPPSHLMARTTMFCVHRTAQITSFLPNISYQRKTFPDALFHQLLIAMGHPDHETRIAAHCVFSTVLMPSLMSPWNDQKEMISENSARLPLKTNNGSFSIPEESETKAEEIGTMDDIQKLDNEVKQSQLLHSNSNSYSFKNAMTNGNRELASLRFSSHQVGLLLSSLWVQATLTDNTPANFEAMAHSYNIALLFTRSKSSSHLTLARCFQLAFSIRRISLDQEGFLQPTRRRSLFTLASSMLIFSARAGNLRELIPTIKLSLTDATVDPYLKLVDNIRLIVAAFDSYGSEDDDLDALKSLGAIESDEQQLKETVLSHLMAKFEKLSEEELSCIKEHLVEEFSPDESFPMGAPSFMETPEPCSPLLDLDFHCFDDVLASASLDEALPDASGSHSGRRTSMSSNSMDILSVNQLLDSVSETAQEVASLPTATKHLPYDQVKDQCEALLTCKQQKMSVLRSFKHEPESRAIVIARDTLNRSTSIPDMVLEESEGAMSLISSGSNDQIVPCSIEHQQAFRLPPASPYEKFLKATTEC